MSAQSYSWSACSLLCHRLHTCTRSTNRKVWCIMKPEIDRRTLLKRMGQAGGLIAAGGTLESLLAACGGDVFKRGKNIPTPRGTPKSNAGIQNSWLLQRGAKNVSGAPH